MVDLKKQRPTRESDSGTLGLVLLAFGAIFVGVVMFVGFIVSSTVKSDESRQALARVCASMEDSQPSATARFVTEQRDYLKLFAGREGNLELEANVARVERNLSELERLDQELVTLKARFVERNCS